jgi:hypothetical protein
MSDCIASLGLCNICTRTCPSYRTRTSRDRQLPRSFHTCCTAFPDLLLVVHRTRTSENSSREARVGTSSDSCSSTPCTWRTCQLPNFVYRHSTLQHPPIEAPLPSPLLPKNTSSRRSNHPQVLPNRPSCNHLQDPIPRGTSHTSALPEVCIYHRADTISYCNRDTTQNCRTFHFVDISCTLFQNQPCCTRSTVQNCRIFHS